MKRTAIGAILVAVTALSLSGCFDLEDDQKSKAQQESSDKLWDIPKPDRSKDKGFTP
ncbi:hypothetical protein IRZ53_07185 [Pseudomonas fulva]|uniref:hypothetical protein n=1 Tax=Pseudomonas fulva TaxID=47880 RepID=UPI0018A8A775|nr:hypothetical protein [Pseudomonas fulva]MBF8674863.1 hypothetical protein [Pseudomonas fulva]MBF8696578.1 hypothetical protein [Pseudomonas fulva]